MNGLVAIEREMAGAVERGVFPGAVLLINKGGRVIHCRAVGKRSVDAEALPMKEETIFDLSSLTKPLATTTAIMMLVKERKLRVEDRVTRFFPNFGVYGKTHVTFRHLLAHCSGLPAWRPYHREVVKIEKKGKINFVGSAGAKEFVYDLLQRERPEAPPGARTIYSDVGFILLGHTVERLSGMSLDRFCQEKIFRPLGLHATSFVDLEWMRRRRFVVAEEMIAPTEHCPWRKKVLCGEVHDDNAYAMGGVAGHAGLFSSARDIDALVGQLVASYWGASSFLPTAILREFWRRDHTVEGSTWAWGWDTPSSSGASCGNLFSPTSVGHLGFTGTSVWIDLEKGVHVVLLSNRIHPRRDNERIQEFRPLIHDLAMEAALAE